MAFTAMVPEIWAARMQANLDKFLVFGNAINRLYQPDAQFGNVVRPFKSGPVAIGDYTQNTDFTGGPETLTPIEESITINQQKFFNFFIDSIDQAQIQPNIMEGAMQRAAYAMADTVDKYIAGLHGDATTKVGTTAAPVAPTDVTIYGYLTDMAKALDKLNVPTIGRYFIMGPAGIKMLKDSGEMLSDTAMGDGVRTLGQFGGVSETANGYKGRISGFDIWMSNNGFVGGTGVTETWYAGHNLGIGLVDSLNEITGYKPEKRFGDAVKGLYVFGADVIDAAAFGVVYTSLA